MDKRIEELKEDLEKTKEKFAQFQESMNRVERNLPLTAEQKKSKETTEAYYRGCIWGLEHALEKLK